MSRPVKFHGKYIPWCTRPIYQPSLYQVLLTEDQYFKSYTENIENESSATDFSLVLVHYISIWDSENGIHNNIL